jgi:hypothetical protein
MDFILLDWTRMGRSYCLAGAVFDQGRWRVLRPLLAKSRGAPVRNVGWSAFLMDGHCRWGMFELVGAVAASPEPPHVEDIWVRSLRPCRRLAAKELRQAILTATTVPFGEPLFGTPLASIRSGAYTQPGMGQRSLTTLVVAASRLRFDGSWRSGMSQPDIRVEVPLPEVGCRWLPVKDHHLLLKAERISGDLDGQVAALNTAVQEMGDPLALRLGLSRPFQGTAEQASGQCWLMADGFFSLGNPQP